MVVLIAQQSQYIQAGSDHLLLYCILTGMQNKIRILTSQDLKDCYLVILLFRVEVR